MPQTFLNAQFSTKQRAANCKQNKLFIGELSNFQQQNAKMQEKKDIKK